MEKLKFECKAYGPGLYTHNYLCAVCLNRSAVYHANFDVLLPCWECQKTGFHLVVAPRFVIWILRKFGFIYE